MKDLAKIVVLSALLLGGYIAYDQWRERQQCVTLKRQFFANMNEMMGPAEAAIAESQRVGNQSPMGSLATRVEENRLVMNRLNAECPGWQTGRYGAGQ